MLPQHLRKEAKTTSPCFRLGVKIMKWVILAGGEYSDVMVFTSEVEPGDKIIAVDSGANFAFRARIQPDYLVGDMDSIDPQVLDYMRARGVDIRVFPPEKDFTDTQLALALAEEMGAKSLIIMGWCGDRFDHSLANLYSGIGIVQRGVRVTYISPGCRVYLVNRELQLAGKEGDLVSLLALSPAVEGVSLEGFAYPLHDAILKYDNPYAVSNRMLESRAKVSIRRGVVAVFHYESGISR